MRAFLLALGVLAWLAWSGLGRAHEVGVSRGEYRTSASAVDVVLGLSHRDAVQLAPGMDADRDGRLTGLELEAAGEGAPFGELVRVRRAGTACSLSVVELRPDDDGVAIVLRAEGGGDAPFELDVAPLVGRLPPGHRHAAILHEPEGSRDALLHASSSTLVLAAPGAPAPPAPRRASVAFDYLREGVVHIFIGTDHVVFLLALLLVGGRLRHVIAMVTAFTVSHSVTLGLAVLGVLAPRPSIIEPLIALSVAYVGVENFLVKDPAKRWRVTGVFGLVHGFGFAGALGEVGVPTDHVPLALASFNVGVELGQLAFIAVVLALRGAARRLLRAPATERLALRGASYAIGSAAAFWLCERLAAFAG
jgi:hydrogenase/urease accessory protein HupE